MDLRRRPNLRPRASDATMSKLPLERREGEVGGERGDPGSSEENDSGAWLRKSGVVPDLGSISGCNLSEISYDTAATHYAWKRYRPVNHSLLSPSPFLLIWPRESHRSDLRRRPVRATLGAAAAMARLAQGRRRRPPRSARTP